MLNVGKDAADYFQSDAEIIKQERRLKKIPNTLGDPFILGSKILRIKSIDSPLLQRTCILIADGGHMCRIFDPLERKVIAKFKGHQGPVTCVTYYHDPQMNDTMIFSGSWDKTVIQWSLKNSSSIRSYSLHTQSVKCIALSPDCRLLYSGSQDKTICKLNLKTHESETWIGHTMCVNDILTFRTFVFSAASDTTIRQWDASTGNCLQIITAHETGVYGLYIDEDENLWSSSPDKYVKRWSLENFSNPECILEHPDSVKPMLVLPCGVLATGSRDEKIRIWNMANEKIIKELDGHYDEVSDLCIIEDKLYSGSYDGTLRFWLIKDALDPNVKFEYNVSDENIKPKVLKKLTEEEEEELNALMENDD